MKSLFGVLALTLTIIEAAAVDELPYKVQATIGDIELRQYASHVLATTGVEATFSEAGNKAFRSLFRFISGDNSSEEKIAMTSPVLQAKTSRGWDISFVMPIDMTRLDVPNPRQETMRIDTVPSQLMAALEYSGGWGEKRFLEKERLLKQQIEEMDCRINGPTVWARYDPPFMPRFMRRNAVLIPVTTDGCEERHSDAKPHQRAVQ